MMELHNKKYKSFKFKQFEVAHDKCAMKVGTDAVLLGAWANVDKSNSILDIGTGTGIIALMLAQRSDAQINAIEIEAQAAMQASDNFNASAWRHRLTVAHISVQEYTEKSSVQYDHIVCNPPYFVASLKAASDTRSLARHNDRLSMASLTDSVCMLMRTDGRFSIVLPYVEGCIFIAHAATKGLFCNRKTNVKTLPNTPVKRLLLEFSNIPSACHEDYLVIGTGQHNTYSDKYMQLTKAYYLAF